jgi:hypothetical protein
MIFQVPDCSLFFNFSPVNSGQQLRQHIPSLAYSFNVRIQAQQQVTERI